MASREASVIRIKPYYFIHVLDNNTNVTRLELGPNTYTRQVCSHLTTTTNQKKKMTKSSAVNYFENKLASWQTESFWPFFNIVPTFPQQQNKIGT